jgi:hypothetical protein
MTQESLLVIVFPLFICTRPQRVLDRMHHWTVIKSDKILSRHKPVRDLTVSHAHTDVDGLVALLSYALRKSTRIMRPLPQLSSNLAQACRKLETTERESSAC